MLKNRIKNLQNKQRKAETKGRLIDAKERQRRESQRWTRIQKSLWENKKVELNEEVNEKHECVLKRKTETQELKVRQEEDRMETLESLSSKAKKQRFENEQRKRQEKEEDLDQKRVSYLNKKAEIEQFKHKRAQKRVEFEDKLKQKVVRKLRKQEKSYKKLMNQVVF